MADELGTARLVITVDDGPARQKLKELREEINRSTQAAGSAANRSTNATRRQTSGSNLSDFLRDLRTREQAETAADLRISRKREERRAREAAKQARIQRDAAAARLRTAPVEGSLRLVGSPRFSARGARQGGASESIRALEQAQTRRFALSQRIERLEERGADVSRLRTRLGELTTAQSQRQFGTARQLSVELDRQVKLANARFRREQDTAEVLARQARLGGPRESIAGRRGLAGSPADLAFLARQGGARSPVGGALNIPGSPAFIAAQQRSAQQQAALLSAEIARQARLGGARSPIGGAADVPGSPAFIAAQRRAGEAQARAYVAEVSRLARQGGARSPIGGAVDIPGSPAFLAAQRRFSAQDLSRAAAIGGPRSPIGGALNLPGSPSALQAEQRLAEARAKAAKAANDAAVAEGRRIGRLNASPIRGGAAFPGSPAFFDAKLRKQQLEQAKQQRLRQQGSKRGQDILSNALIGGAFPALFGQGIGASLGGALGGAGGGALGGQFGFGLSLVGTAVGAQIDLLNQRFVELGNALQDPIANFDVFIQKAVLASKAQEALAQALQESGQSAAAAQLIEREARRTIDPVVAEGAANAQDNFNRALSDTQDVLGNIVSGPASGFLNFLASTLRLISGAPAAETTTTAYTRAFESRTNAANRIGLNAGALASGLLLSAGGVAALATGAGAPIGAGLLGTGLSLLGVGGAGAASASGDFRVASSEAVLQLEKQVEAAKDRQLELEGQIQKARAAGNTGLEKSLNTQAEFNKLRQEEASGLSRIEQERQRNMDFVYDLEDDAAASRQQIDLRKSLDLRRSAIINASAADATAAQKSLKDARELAGTYGAQRDILIEQQKIRQAERSAAEAQRKFNAAPPTEREALGNDLNRAINLRDQARVEGGDAIASIERAERDKRISAAEAAKQGAESARQNFTQAGNQVSAAGDSLAGALKAAREAALAMSRSAEGAAAAIESTNKASFQFLTESRQQKILQDATKQVNAAVESGLFSSKALASPDSILAAEAALGSRFSAVQGANDAFRSGLDAQAGAAAGVAQADQAFTNAKEAYTNASKELAIALNDLSTKNWAVQVNVASDGSSQAYGDILAGAVSP